MLGFAGSTRKLRTLLVSGLFACSLLLLLGGSRAWAAPAWLPSTNLSAPNKGASNSDVAMDAAGDAVAVWERNNVLEASVHTAGGGFAAPVDLSTASHTPKVAMTPSGTAVVAWRFFNGSDNLIEVSTRPPGGSFSAPVTVGVTASGFTPDLVLGVDASGDTAVAWQHKLGSGINVIAVSTRPAGGAFSPEHDVSDAADPATAPAIAVYPNGEALVAWQGTDGTTTAAPNVRASIGAGASFSTPAVLSTGVDNAIQPQAAVDAAGDAIVLWDGFATLDPGDDMTPPTYGNGIVQESSRPAGGDFSPFTDLSDSSQSAGSEQIAMAPSGAATAVWTRSDGSNFVIQAAAGSPSGFSAPKDLSTSGHDAFTPRVAMSAAGAVTVAWQRTNGNNQIAQATTGPSVAGQSAPKDLSASGEDAFLPAPAMDAGNDAVVVWLRSDGTNDIAQASAYDASAPLFRGVSIPASATVGDPVSFSADPFDVWGIASTTFNFGDGASATGTSASHAYSKPGTYTVGVTAVDSGGTPVATSGTISVLASSHFDFGKQTRNKKKGIATLEVSLPGPGKVTISGKGVKKASKRAEKAGTLKLTVKATGKQLKALKKKGKVKLKVSVSFAPDGGPAASQTTTVKLLEKLKP